MGPATGEATTPPIAKAEPTEDKVGASAFFAAYSLTKGDAPALRAWEASGMWARGEPKCESNWVSGH
jgi:hypothetical protein